MNWSGLSRGRQLLLVSSVLLLIDSFFKWQKACFGDICAGVSGWHGFWGVVMGLLTIVLIAWLIVAAMNLVDAKVGVDHHVLEAAIAGLLTLVVIIKFLTANELRAWPSWVGLILGLLIGVGAYLRFSEGPTDVRAHNPATTGAAPPPPPPPA
jgi:hypothetical protein